MQIKNSVVLVTGGSSGIGKATAALLAEKGAKVYISGRDVAKLRSVAALIGAHTIEAPMEDDAALEAGMAQIVNNHGRLDALINNAGIGEFGPMESVNRETFRRVFETNVFGAAIAGSIAAKIFMQQRHGNIVNIGSSASLKGFANGSVYSASKFALRALSECWRTELRPYNVRVIQVNPSEVPTAFNRPDRDERLEQANKLRASDLAYAIVSALEMDDRGFIPELGVWATNPF